MSDIQQPEATSPAKVFGGFEPWQNGHEVLRLYPQPLVIEVFGSDGTALLRIEETAEGTLDVTGPEDRWTEGCARFVAGLRDMVFPW